MLFLGMAPHPMRQYYRKPSAFTTNIFLHPIGLQNKEEHFVRYANKHCIFILCRDTIDKTEKGEAL